MCNHAKSPYAVTSHVQQACEDLLQNGDSFVEGCTFGTSRFRIHTEEAIVKVMDLLLSRLVQNFAGEKSP